jgi:hypothetical protein
MFFAGQQSGAEVVHDIGLCACIFSLIALVLVMVAFLVLGPVNRAYGQAGFSNVVS